MPDATDGCMVVRWDANRRPWFLQLTVNSRHEPARVMTAFPLASTMDRDLADRIARSDSELFVVPDHLAKLIWADWRGSRGLEP